MLHHHPGLGAALEAVQKAQAELDALGERITEARAHRDATLAVLNAAMQRAGMRTIIVGSQVYRASGPGYPAEVVEATVVAPRAQASQAWADTALLPTKLAALS